LVAKAPDLTNIFTIIDNRDVIFTQFIGSAGRPLRSTQAEHVLHGIERRYAVGLDVFNQPLRVHHYIVIDNEKDFALCRIEASVHRRSTYLAGPPGELS
jgi:hypothetical protein